jgi:hypothetical protein
MTSVTELKESVSVCMFAQGGTIVDMPGGLRAVAAADAFREFDDQRAAGA